MTLPTNSATTDLVARLQLGVSLAGIGLASIDYVTDTMVVDAAAAALFRVRADVVIPRAEIHARFHPESAAHMMAVIAECLNPDGSGFLSEEHLIVGPDGSDVWVAAHKQVSFKAREPGGRLLPNTGLLAVRNISNRKSVEAKLRVSEVRYRRLFEAAHDGVLLLDPETAKIVDANPFMTRLLGYSHDQLVGKELFEIGLLKDTAASQGMFTKLSRTHEVRYENLPLESADGLHRDVEVVANLYDEAGRAIIQCNIRDITERKQIEAIALQNAQLFSTLIEEAPTGVYVIDDQFRMMQINRLALPAFSTISPLIGRDFSEIVEITWGKEVGERIVAIFRHTLATGERYISPAFTEQRQDLGVRQSYEWEAQRVTLSNGKHGVVCYFSDVTERRHAQDIVAEREAHVRSIIDNTQTFIGLLSTDGSVLEANVSVLTAGGVGRDRVIGRKIWDLGWWLDNPTEAARMKDAVSRSAAGEIVRYDLTIITAAGRRLDVDFMVAPVRDASGAVTLLVPSALDITDRKKSLDQIQSLMGEVNHRAMNLLSVVQAVARQTARDGDPATFVTRLTERIAGLAASQDLLVQNEWQGVDVVDLVRAQLAHYRGVFGTHVLIAGPAARLTAAAAQGIGMALHELATNAGKYGSLSTTDGRVHVTWAVVASVPAMFEMRWREEGGPAVTLPSRKGFGQKVIGQMVEAAVNGDANLEYAETGFSWTLIAPVADTLEASHTNVPAQRSA